MNAAKKAVPKKPSRPEPAPVNGPTIGEAAPEIALADETGAPFRLSSLRGNKVVVYFYPKASTGGCTKESEAFRDAQAAFTREGAVIIGLSPDTSAALQKFKTKSRLPFTLLSDLGHAVADAYGVWKEKSLYGRTFMGIERTTFVLDAEGKVQSVFRKVKVDGHVDAVLAAVKAG